jgi:hypothetical protein
VREHEPFDEAKSRAAAQGVSDALHFDEHVDLAVAGPSLGGHDHDGARPSRGGVVAAAIERSGKQRRAGRGPAVDGRRVAGGHRARCRDPHAKDGEAAAVGVGVDGEFDAGRAARARRERSEREREQREEPRTNERVCGAGAVLGH